jgi:hypothetical protein
MAITRISITLPRELAKAIDAKARELDRSRSWVIAEAARQFVETGSPVGGAPAAAVRESSPVIATSEIAAARRRHLHTEAKLSPGERVWRAEDLTRIARQSQRRRPRRQVIGFDSYEDFYEWKKADRIGR